MSPATFVHIGDCHMGPNARNADRWRALDQIIAENLRHGDALAAWLIPGDLNHARMTIEDRNAWAERLRAMAAEAPVVLCYGNHDVPGDLDVFAKLSAAWPISVVSTPEVLSVPLAPAYNGGSSRFASIFVLPYPTEAGLVASGIAPGDMVENARVALDAIFLEAAAQLQTARERGDLTLMMGHVNVAGSITSTGQPNIGHEIELDAALIARLGDGYVGLNHIHKAQAIAGAHYPGSICRLDWGECDPKGYLRITITDCGYLVETCPIDVAPMVHVDGWLARDGFTREGRIGDVIRVGSSQWKGCEVRVRAKYHQSEKGILDFAKAHIFADFAEAKRFELELVAVPDTALRAPEVAAAKTLAEKVTAWATETKTVLPVTVLEVLPALEHGDPDMVIAGEQALMDELLDPTAAEEERTVAVA